LVDIFPYLTTILKIYTALPRRVVKLKETFLNYHL